MTREAALAFLEGQTPIGRAYEIFSGLLVCLSVFAFITGTLYVDKYYPYAPPFECGKTCDALWFGIDSDNALSFLGIGATSLLELLTVLLFTVEYAVRFWTADLKDSKFCGVRGRLRFMVTFESLVDLASILPSYLNALVLHDSLRVIRIFRLFRMLRIEGRYDLALCMIDDVLREQRAILGTALFVGSTTWLVVSSLYYVAERRNTDMIYCGAAPGYCEDDIDTSKCTIDAWGFVDCTEAGCPPTDDYPEPCYNLFRSIPSASYLALLNLFGEYPMITTHSIAGQVVGTLVAVIAVAFFAIPAGIIGSGFEDIVSRRKEERAALRQQSKEAVDDESGDVPNVFIGDGTTIRGQVYNFFHAKTTFGSIVFEYYTSALVIGTTLAFMLGTVFEASSFKLAAFMDEFELVSAVVFTAEYLLKMYSIVEDPEFSDDGSLFGRLRYAKGFFSVVDLLSFLPFWINATGAASALEMMGIAAAFPSAPTLSNVAKCLRLLRLLRFERYTKAFTTFDDIIKDNIDVLAVTGFTALLLWIFFSAVLYFSERNNPDVEMASYYNSLPKSMWVTLLNLSGESPLSNYSVVGKVATGIIGLFASALFGIPISVLGAGFEELATEDDDEGSALDETDDEDARNAEDRSSALELACFRFVNGVGSKAAEVFELTSYLLIAISVSKGIVQTLPGYEHFLQELDWPIILFFTAEYALRFIGATAAAEFSANPGPLGLRARVRFLFSFFSIIDLLAIVPFYYASAMPGSWVDDHAVYLRMFRLLRLLKLEKYFPSITLIDDVFRLKKNAMIKTCFAAGTLWLFFAALLYLAENHDTANGIDPVPLYGCELYNEELTVRKKRLFLGIPMGRKKVVTGVLHYDCTMSNRFTNFFDSLVYAGVHLTGDFPIITYNTFGKIVCFFIVVAAVGVVSIPAGLIASGFAEIVEGRVQGRRGKVQRGNAGDDWYEFRLAELRGQDPPQSRFGPAVDQLQTKVHDFLNGKTVASLIFRWVMFVVISINVLAVVLESIPEVDRFVGDKDGNFFSRLEIASVFFFAIEYALRLFSASKSVEALYSPWVYATTFFGIVDLISVAPFFVQKYMESRGMSTDGSELGKIFSVMRIFRILQIEGLWAVAFSKLDNVFRASKDVLKATGLMALIVWLGCGALFFLFEGNNPNWRECDVSIPLVGTEDGVPGCYDFPSTAACNEYYPGMCSQVVFTNLPSTLFYTAVFLVGEWGLVDFSTGGRVVCMFLCVAGIGLYAIPVGSLFDSFSAVLGMDGGEDDDDDDGDNDKEKSD